MAGLDESTEALKAKLETYGQQLSTVDAALAAQPEEEQLVKLRSDLLEVINLTKDLIKFQQDTDSSGAGAEAGAELTGAQAVEEAEAEHASGSDGSFLLNVEEALAAARRQGAATASESGAFAAPALIGRTCQLPFQGKPHYAEILQVKQDAQGERAVVRFIGWGATEEVSLAQLSLLQPPPPAMCVPGTAARALFSQDGLWYDCVIDEQTEVGYRVSYVGYASTEEVKFDQVRLKAQGAREAPRKKLKEVITPGGYRIPENLQVKTTDNEATRSTKRRKAKLIKQQQKQEMEDKAAKNQAVSWRRFNQKALQKKRPGFKQSHQSIFKSADSGEIGRGSRVPKFQTIKNAANTFAPRRRHDYEEGESDDDEEDDDDGGGEGVKG
eukprot:GHVT01039360.1.p1 GENE.GHVT01039360.1~~GHVT01039360.1.p1  ORF type:complete len:384 (+),score=113.73 GHVT01039360.1:331-1482(+)